MNSNMDEIINNKKKSKTFWFILGIIIPVVFLIVSVLPIFVYAGLLCMVVDPRSIFSYLNEIHILLIVLSLLIYLYEFVFTFIYWKKSMKYGKLIQIINISVSVIYFIVTFVIAYNAAIDDVMKLFCMK